MKGDQGVALSIFLKSQMLTDVFVKHHLSFQGCIRPEIPRYMGNSLQSPTTHPHCLVVGRITFILQSIRENLGAKMCFKFQVNLYEGCSKFFHLENVIFAKKKFFRRTFANSMFFFRGTCWRRFFRKTWMCDILKLFQASDPSSLHSASAALKHLRSALRCWSLLTFISQFWHNKSTV